MSWGGGPDCHFWGIAALLAGECSPVFPRLTVSSLKFAVLSVVWSVEPGRVSPTRAMDMKESRPGHAEGPEGDGKKKKRRTLFLFGGGKKDSSKEGSYRSFITSQQALMIELSLTRTESL